MLESRIDAAESISPLLTTIFAIANRVRPYNKYLVWELTEHPLTSIDSQTFLSQITSILDGEVEAEKQVFTTVEKLARAKGFGEVFDAWGDDLDLLK